MAPQGAMTEALITSTRQENGSIILNQSETGIPRDLEPAAELHCKATRGLQMRCLKVRKLAVEWDLLKQLERNPAISTAVLKGLSK